MTSRVSAARCALRSSLSVATRGVDGVVEPRGQLKCESRSSGLGARSSICMQHVLDVNARVIAAMWLRVARVKPGSDNRCLDRLVVLGHRHTRQSTSPL